MNNITFFVRITTLKSINCAVMICSSLMTSVSFFSVFLEEISFDRSPTLNFKIHTTKYMDFVHWDTRKGWLHYKGSKKQNGTLHPPLPGVWVFDFELCLESDGTRVNGILSMAIILTKDKYFIDVMQI